MKKGIMILALICVVFCLILPTLTACNDATNTNGTDRLVIYNWEDYIDTGDSEAGRNNILDDFKQYYRDVTGRNLSITYTTYDTNETMMTKMLKGDANVDLICPSEYSIEKLLTAGLLKNQAELYEELKPQLDEYGVTLDGMSSVQRKQNGYGKIEKDIMDVISGMFSEVVANDGKVYDMTEYMVPYMWGTLGILYNKRIISEEELEKYGWGVLWNVQKNSELENKILMKDSVRDTYAAALFYMYEYDLLPEGYEDITTAQELINITDPQMLDAAEKILTEQRDHISGYEVDFGKDDMINEIVYADFAWSGDALWAVEESYDEDIDDYTLGYYCPSGVNPVTKKSRFSNIWYDGWVIPTTVNNSLAAMMFIDFMCQPENAIRNSVAIGYTCAADRELLKDNEDVLVFLEDQEYDPDEYFDDIGRYPTIDPSLGVMRDFGSRNESLVNMWQRAKSGGIDVSLAYVIAAIAGAIVLAIAIYFIAQALKTRPRKINVK